MSDGSATTLAAPPTPHALIKNFFRPFLFLFFCFLVRSPLFLFNQLHILIACAFYFIETSIKFKVNP